MVIQSSILLQLMPNIGNNKCKLAIDMKSDSRRSPFIIYFSKLINSANGIINLILTVIICGNSQSRMEEKKEKLYQKL